MKKKLLLISAFLYSIATTIFAVPITEIDAKQKASKFINERSAKAAPVQSKSIISDEIMFTTAESCDAFYVFNNESGGGYVIVSADDKMPAVLGYSYTSTFKSDEIPENMRAWLNGYVEQYEYMLQHDDVTAVYTTSVSGNKIYPLLTSQWSQYYPYNAQCPTIGNSDTPTGCVATAMAQIMYYHQWPKQTTQTIPGYTTMTNNIVMPEIGVTTIDWDIILPTYSSWSKYDTEQENAISKLFLLCGTAVEMNYDIGGSGASTYAAMNALGKYFGYPDYSMSHVWQKDFQQSVWNQMIYDEIRNNRPVLYSGDSRTGGHAFIIDGYDKDDYFHVNWGWGGYQDDYFLLNALNGYNSNQDAIIGIESPETPEGAKYAYATYKDNTLSFHFDNKREERQEVIFTSFSPVYDAENYRYIMDWYDYAPNITSVVFDDSFSECKITSTAYWFRDFVNLTNLDISNLNSQYVTDMRYMFYNCSSLQTLDVGNFNTQNATDMYCIFYNCSNLQTLDLSSFNTQNVTNMGFMFYNCSSLQTLDVSNFNTQNVTDMRYMFYNCSSLQTLDVGNFNTQNATDMYCIFYNCSNLQTLDLSSFNTQNVTNMSWMFGYCSSLTSLDVSNFNTQNVTDMSSMFYNCKSLTNLDVSNFNTQNVTNMSWMFGRCENIKTIYVGVGWNTANVTDSEYMFYNCSNIVGQDGTKYNYDYSNVSKAHYGAGGYLTYKNPSAIEEVTSNTYNNILPRKFYSAEGKQLSQPQKGLNILKMSDGTTRKVVK